MNAVFFYHFGPRRFLPDFRLHRVVLIAFRLIVRCSWCCVLLMTIAEAAAVQNTAERKLEITAAGPRCSQVSRYCSVSCRGGHWGHSSNKHNILIFATMHYLIIFVFPPFSLYGINMVETTNRCEALNSKYVQY